MEALIRQCQKAKDQGQTQSELLQFMHRKGVTITEAIKACMKLYRLPLAEAKDVVSSSRHWQDIVEAAGPLHDRLAEDAQDLAVLQARSS